MFLSQFIFYIFLSSSSAVTGQTEPSFTARAGDEVTLPCKNVIKNQDKCDGTTWLVSRSDGQTAGELINLGKTA